MMDSAGRHKIYGSATYTNSAIARLLITGNLGDVRATSPATSSKETQENEPPLDLSYTAKAKEIVIPTQKVTSEEQQGNSLSNKRKLDAAFGNTESNMKCPYCPMVFKDGSKLYSHYQFHKHILTVSAPTATGSTTESNPNSPRVQEHSEPTSEEAAEPATTQDSTPLATTDSSSSTLRTLLQPKAQKQAESHSASKYLKSIVQNIIKQRMPVAMTGHSSMPASRASTPAYDHSRSSSRISSPRTAPSPSLTDRGHQLYAPSPVTHRDSPGNGHFVSSTPLSGRSPESIAAAIARKTIYNRGEATSPVAPQSSLSNTETLGPKSGTEIKHEHKDDPESDVSSYTSNGGYEPDVVNSSALMQVYNSTSTERRYQSYANQVKEHREEQQTSPGQPDNIAPERHLSALTMYRHMPSKKAAFVEDVSKPLGDSPYGQTKEAVVQCHLSAPSDCRQAADSATGDVNHSRCHHCGISFDDEVIFSIHMGCHNHRDPFICNVCGRPCGNKYAFYTHIMRGHEYS